MAGGLQRGQCHRRFRSPFAKSTIGEILHARDKRRIAFQVCEQVPENPIVEDAVAGAERSLALAERIPRQSQPRLEIVRIVCVKLAPGAGPTVWNVIGGVPMAADSGDWTDCRRVQRELRRTRSATQLQCQIVADLPGILKEKAVFVLDELSEVRRSALSRSR